MAADCNAIAWAKNLYFLVNKIDVNGGITIMCSHLLTFLQLLGTHHHLSTGKVQYIFLFIILSWIISTICDKILFKEGKLQAKLSNSR